MCFDHAPSEPWGNAVDGSSGLLRRNLRTRPHRMRQTNVVDLESSGMGRMPHPGRARRLPTTTMCETCDSGKRGRMLALLAALPLACMMLAPRYAGKVKRHAAPRRKSRLSGSDREEPPLRTAIATSSMGRRRKAGARGVDDETAPFVRFFPLNDGRNRATRKQRLNVRGWTSERWGEAEGGKERQESGRGRGRC